jgi:hypothetical protein
MRTSARVLLIGAVWAVGSALSAFSAFAQRPALAQTVCVVETKKETKEGLKILHFRNTCKFPVWAIVKSKDTGHYGVHLVEPGATHEEPGIDSFPQVVGWCREGDRDCLSEYGFK